MRRRLFRGLGWGALAVLSLSMACVDKGGGDTGKAPLYVYDGTSNTVMVWDDINDLYKVGDGGAAPAPNRTIDLKTAAQGLQLSWGGMAINSSNQSLFLTASDGSKILRILHVGAKSGDLSNYSTDDRIAFGVDSTGTGGFSGGVLGQAAVNTNGDLLISEWSPSKSQIWKIMNSVQTNSAGKTLTGSEFLVSNPATGDNTCTGVAVVGQLACARPRMDQGS